MMENPHAEGADLPARQQFEQTFLPHLDAAYNLARWLMRNDQDAEDSVQEAYLRAFKSFSRFRGGDGKAWLMTIVRNVCFTGIKKLRSHETAESFDEEIHHAACDTASTELLQQRANAETLQLALGKLPAEFREMIVLHDLAGLSYKEIATVVAIPIGDGHVTPCPRTGPTAHRACCLNEQGVRAMKCEDVSHLLDAYMDGELDLTACLGVEEHLASCPACRRILEDRQALTTIVSEKVPRFAPSPFLETRLRAALKAEAGGCGKVMVAGVSRGLDFIPERLGYWPLL